MRCRVCDSPNTRTVFSLSYMPLANSLLSSPTKAFKKYPLDLMLCKDCSLVQIGQIVPPEELFVNYNYLTSYSTPMVEHAKQLVNEVLGKNKLEHDSLVVEIGSNDGYLLQHYAGVKRLGIDPSERAADAAMEKGVPTIRSFFDKKLALEMGIQADVIHANNVLAHIPELNDFVAGLSILLKHDGLLIVEVPYLCRLIDKTSFDTIYHEHVYYSSLTSLWRLFARHGLTIAEVDM